MSKRKPSKQPTLKQMIEKDHVEYQDILEKAKGSLDACNILADMYPQIQWGDEVDAEVITKSDETYQQSVEVLRTCETRIHENEAEAKNTMEKYGNKKLKPDDTHFKLLTLSQELIIDTINIPADKLNEVTHVKIENGKDGESIDIDEMRRRAERALIRMGDEEEI